MRRHIPFLDIIQESLRSQMSTVIVGRGVNIKGHQWLGQLWCRKPVSYSGYASQAVENKKESSTSEGEAESEWKTAKPFEQIPGDRVLPFLGTMWTMLPVVGYGIDTSRILEVFKVQHIKYGPIWKVVIPGTPPIVTITRPEDTEKLFRMEGKFPVRPGFDTLRAYRAQRIERFTSGGILATSGESWWKIRSKAQQPLLKVKSVMNYVPALGKITEEFIDRIRLIRLENNEMKPDFINEMYRWALESVTLIGLNTRLGCLSPDLTPDSEAQKMIDAVSVSFKAVLDLEFGLPLWKYFTTPTLRKFFEAQDYFTDTTMKHINKNLEAIKQRPSDSEEDPSILEELFILGLTPKDAMVMVIDMLMAGIDTTSHAASFLMYYLARNPLKQETLRREIISIVGPKENPVTPAALIQLQYLKACLKESLRLMPVTSANTRITDKSLVLSGYQIPKGSMVLSMHQLMGRSEEYFPNANEFIPERWIKGHPLESHHHPYTLLHFGFGTKMCIGRRLAEIEIGQLIIKIVQNFNIEYHHQDIGCVSRLINTPDQPLRFRFIDIK